MRAIGEIQPKPAVAALAAKVDHACVAAGQAFLDRNRALATPAFAVADCILYESHLTRHDPHYEAVGEYSLFDH